MIHSRVVQAEPGSFALCLKQSTHETRLNYDVNLRLCFFPSGLMLAVRTGWAFADDRAGGVGRSFALLDGQRGAVTTAISQAYPRVIKLLFVWLSLIKFDYNYAFSIYSA